MEITMLLDHAEARFVDWNLPFREETELMLKDLHCQDLTFGGRAFSALRIYEESLVREVTGRIAIYEAVSDEFRNSEMLSRSQLDQLRERVMASVGWSIRSLEDRLQRDRAASGDPYPLPNPHRYITIESNILDVVNSKLRVLETKGAIPKSGPVHGGSASGVNQFRSESLPAVLETPAPVTKNAGTTAPETQERRSSRKRTRQVRRNEKYQRIDAALRECAEARASSHENVFQILDDRNVAIPNVKTFKSAGSWLKGFQRDTHSASVWLSKRWAGLDLPSFVPGPKKKFQ